MECSTEDSSDFEKESCQRLPSSLEFSTIMRAMKVARRGVSKKRGSTLQVPEIKVTLISDTEYDEGKNLVEFIQSDDSFPRSASVYEEVEENVTKAVSPDKLEGQQLLYEEVKPKSFSGMGVNMVTGKSKKLQKNRHDNSSKTPPTELSGHKNRCLYSANSLNRQDKSSGKENLIFTGRSKSYDQEVRKGKTTKNGNTIKSVGKRRIANKTGKANTFRELQCIEKIEKGNCGAQSNLHYHQSKQTHITKADKNCIELRQAHKSSIESGDSCKRNKSGITIKQPSESRELKVNRMCFAMNIREIPEIVLEENLNKNRSLSPRLHQNKRNCWKLSENVSGPIKQQKEKVNLLKTSQLKNLSRSDSDLSRYFPAIGSDLTIKHNATKGEKIDSLKPIKKRDNVSHFKSEKNNSVLIQTGSGYNIGKSIMERNPDNLSDNPGRVSTSSKTANLLPLGRPTETRTFVFPKSVQNHLNPSMEGWKMPVNANVRSRSWSDIRLLSKVFNQINALYSDVTTPEVPKVKVDDVLKSWHVQHNDVNFIRSAVKSPRAYTDFNSASYEQLKQCRYLRNETNCD